MDDAYGMKSSLQIPDNLFLSPTLDQFDTLHYTSHIKGKGNVTYGYTEMNYTVSPIPLGSLEYRGQNNYWIPQTYYYQTGGCVPLPGRWQHYIQTPPGDFLQLQ